MSEETPDPFSVEELDRLTEQGTNLISAVVGNKIGAWEIVHAERRGLFFQVRLRNPESNQRKKICESQDMWRKHGIRGLVDLASVLRPWDDPHPSYGEKT